MCMATLLPSCYFILQLYIGKVKLSNKCSGVKSNLFQSDLWREIEIFQIQYFKIELSIVLK